MHDRISHYRQLRLITQLQANTKSVDWCLWANRVTKGIPNASVIDQGRLGGPYDFETIEGLVITQADVLEVLDRRWRLS